MRLAKCLVHSARRRVVWFLMGMLLAAMVAGCAVRKATLPPVQSKEALAVEPAGEAMSLAASAPAVARQVEALPGDAAAPSSSERLVIKTADLAVVVEDPPRAQDQVIAWAEAHGGYVVNSSLTERTLPSGKRVLYGHLSFRVPADQFLPAVEQVVSLAVRVERKDLQGQDVTDEYVDLEARLRNLQAAEAELRRLMEQATDTEQVLDIYRELMQVREQIEVLQGRMRYLKESVAYALVEVEFIPVAADEPISVAGWEPQGVARDALRALVRAVQGLVNLLIWLVLFVLPYLLLLALVAAPFVLLARWLWRRLRRAKTAAEKQ